MKYADYLDVMSSHSHEGIFYAFDDEQFKRGLEKCGYTSETKILKDGFGGFGTREAFDRRHQFYKDTEEKIKRDCTPEEIFSFEYWNHECGYSYDYSEALEIVQLYFPDWLPTAKLLNKIQKENNEF